MRIIPVDMVQEGSYLGKTIFDNEGRILLKKGFTLKRSLLKKIKENGISHIYISDNANDIEISDALRPELRQKSVNLLKGIFESIDASSPTHNIQLDDVCNVSEEILNDILKNDNILISLIDIKNMDNYTYQHSVNVAVISVIIGVGLNLSRDELSHLCIGAILHDIGKVLIPNEIIKKPGALTDTEFKKIKTHSQKGYEYIYDCPNISKKSKEIIRYHHEKFNGTGYPQGLSGHEIPLLARIAGVADVYDALTSNRPYRTPIMAHEAIEYIMANCGTAFDIDIVSVFAKLIVPYPKGTLVSLSNGDTCIVEDNNVDYPLRPILKVVESKIREVNTTFNLLKELSLVITGIKYYI